MIRILLKLIHRIRLPLKASQPVLVLLLSLFGVSATAGEERRITGAFIQLNAVNSRSGQGYWNEQLEGMKALGMDTAIIQYVAYDHVYHYPTKLRGMIPARADVVMQLLNAARAVGIKVFLGLQLSDGFWQHEFDLQQRVDLNTRTINELHQRYGSHAGLGGWYLPEEIDNETAHKPYADDLLEYLRRLTTRAHELSKHPVMISPFFGRNVDLLAYARWWDNEALPRIQIDIVAMQDGIGTHRTALDDLSIVFSALSPVMKRHGVRFWANLEAFDQTAGWPVNDRPFASQPTTFDRLEKQMQATTASTVKTILFEYTQNVNPHISARSRRLHDSLARAVRDEQ